MRKNTRCVRISLHFIGKFLPPSGINLTSGVEARWAISVVHCLLENPSWLQIWQLSVQIYTAFGYHLVINLKALSVKLYSLKNPQYTPKYEKRKKS